MLQWLWPVTMAMMTGIFSSGRTEIKNDVSCQRPSFRALVLYENGGHHVAYSKAARMWLDQLAADSSFTVDYIKNTEPIDDAFLKNYQVFIQLDYPPYGWTDKAVRAFERYITNAQGGWIGFHHATLLGEFDGFPMWNWFSKWMGGIRFKNYIATFADGTVMVEDRTHPCMAGIGDSMRIKKEEWYTYDRSPRGDVRVLASVKESSYQPTSTIAMGDHPVVWSNDKYPGRNIYIFMGHAPELLEDKNYTTLFRNAIFWAAGRTKR